MTDTRKKPFGARLTRRSFLQRAGLGAAVALGGAPWKADLATGGPRTLLADKRSSTWSSRARRTAP